MFCDAVTRNFVKTFKFIKYEPQRVGKVTPGSKVPLTNNLVIKKDRKYDLAFKLIFIFKIQL